MKIGVITHYTYRKRLGAPFFQSISNEQTCIIQAVCLNTELLAHLWQLSFICNINHKHCRKFSSQNIFNARNFDPQNKPTTLLNMATCTQSMQRTWWLVANTTTETWSDLAADRFSISMWILHPDIISWRGFQMQINIDLSLSQIMFTILITSYKRC